MVLCVYRNCSCIAWLFLVFVTVVNAAYDESDPLNDVQSSPVHHECVHDEVAIPYHQLPRSYVSPQRGGLRATTASVGVSKREYIRFHVIFLFEHACASVQQTAATFQGKRTVPCTEDNVLTARKKGVLRSLVKDALGFFSKTILVDSLETMHIRANACPNVESSAVTVVNADYLVYVTANPGPGSSAAAAWARPCRVDANTLRPIVGQINFVPSFIKTYYSDFEKHVALHELTHALGFSDIARQVKRYRDADGMYGEGSAVVFREHLGKHVTIIKTPNLLRVAREHFGCPTLDGVEVEDGGGRGTPGSHWKKRILYEEVLVGVVTSAKLYYSSFTLAFLEDLGYYSIDYRWAEDDLLWGRNKSCRFLYNKCNDQTDQVDEYCFSEGSFFSSGSCTHDRMGIGTCDISHFRFQLPPIYQYFGAKDTGGSHAEMDYCPAVNVYSNRNCVTEQQYDLMNVYGHEFTPHSRCFESNIIAGVLPRFAFGARCFPVACTAAGRAVVRVQGQPAPCPASGAAGLADTSRLRGVHGAIRCPEAKRICRGTDGSGVSSIPETGGETGGRGAMAQAHSSVEFGGRVAKSCEERVKCAEKLNLWYATCRLTAQKILGCFGTDCTVERKRWLEKSRWPQKCGNRKALAQECADGWLGVIEICAVASVSM